MDSVKVVSSSSLLVPPEDLKVLLESSCKPLVLRNRLGSWLNTRSWRALDVCQDLSATPHTTFKIFHRRGSKTYNDLRTTREGRGTFFETDCMHVHASFFDFKEWLEAQSQENENSACRSPPKRVCPERGVTQEQGTVSHDLAPGSTHITSGSSHLTSGSTHLSSGSTHSHTPSKETRVNKDNPLCVAMPTSDFWVYADYKYMCNVCKDVPSLQQAVDWGVLGFEGRGWKDSALWVGSKGACTPCHYDTYGFNLVAQLSGEKKWLLFPPGDSEFLYPTRVPFEELSVFSEVDVGGGEADFDRHPLFKKTSPHEVWSTSHPL